MVKIEKRLESISCDDSRSLIDNYLSRVSFETQPDLHVFVNVQDEIPRTTLGKIGFKDEPSEFKVTVSIRSNCEKSKRASPSSNLNFYFKSCECKNISLEDISIQVRDWEYNS